VKFVGCLTETVLVPALTGVSVVVSCVTLVWPKEVSKVTDEAAKVTEAPVAGETLSGTVMVSPGIRPYSGELGESPLLNWYRVTVTVEGPFCVEVVVGPEMIKPEGNTVRASVSVA